MLNGLIVRLVATIRVDLGSFTIRIVLDLVLDLVVRWESGLLGILDLAHTTEHGIKVKCSINDVASI